MVWLSLLSQLREEADWKEKLELERARTMNKVQPKTNYKEKYEHLIGKDAALDAARSGSGSDQSWDSPSGARADP